MDYPDHDIAVQVDAANPGEFFACCGLLELADRLSSGAEGWFDYDQFFVAFSGPSKAVTIHEILWALVNANVDQVSEDEDKESPLQLSGTIDFRIDWWIDSHGRKNALKTWAGNQDSLKMFSKWESPLKEILEEENPDPSELFQAQRTLQGPYGFDPKFGWDALSVGFSLNEHTRYKKSQTRPRSRDPRGNRHPAIHAGYDRRVRDSQVFNVEGSLAPVGRPTCGGEQVTRYVTGRTGIQNNQARQLQRARHIPTSMRRYR